MKQPPILIVAPFENRNGVTSYRVTGWVNGDRVRKNFKTRAEANAEKPRWNRRRAGRERHANGRDHAKIEHRAVLRVCRARLSVPMHNLKTTRAILFGQGIATGPEAATELSLMNRLYLLNKLAKKKR
jgi:hypothetical protein